MSNFHVRMGWLANERQRDHSMNKRMLIFAVIITQALRKIAIDIDIWLMNVALGASYPRDKPPHIPIFGNLVGRETRNDPPLHLSHGITIR